MSFCSGPSKRKRSVDDVDGENEEDLQRAHDRFLLKEQQLDNEYEHFDLDDDEEEEDDNEDGPVIVGMSSTKPENDVTNIFDYQEAATITRDKEIKITPFNLEEELEEGQFDRAGNFLFKRESETDDELKDTWAESIDWSEIEKKEQEARILASDTHKPTHSEDNREQSDEHQDSLVNLDRLTCYKRMLRIMRADETVQKTIRRLGQSVPKRQFVNNKLKQKNKLQASSADAGKADSNQEIDEAKRKLESMIEYAHKLLGDGELDIYQKSYEDLEDAIN